MDEFICSSCGHKGEERRFIFKLLSLQYRAKNDNFESFNQLKCPKCNSLVTIVFNALNNQTT